MPRNTLILDTYRLALKLAELTGNTNLGAINIALRERLERERQKSKSDTKLRDTQAIARRCAALVGSGASSMDHDEELYDEYGLPK